MLYFTGFFLISSVFLFFGCQQLSGHFFLASPEAGMGTLQDPDPLPMAGTLDAYRTTSFSALSSFSATPRLVQPPYTRKLRPF